jgi:hypothetical protein
MATGEGFDLLTILAYTIEQGDPWVILCIEGISLNYTRRKLPGYTKVKGCPSGVVFAGYDDANGVSHCKCGFNVEEVVMFLCQQEALAESGQGEA